ncbi:class I SAM-dependent methyltransferase [Helicobacter sp. MIT 00-7814]|uniref:class I SAM-dependent methyltransferase n=1 Tax=Helicobacter sp. MIT 00-7814 TaxID=2040650 RepID=UPI001C69B58B|nr:class I SAM-dependent methyltransferase [Helicobacter sp. MIT 00-7814]
MNFQESKTPKETPLDSLLRVLRLRQVLPSIKQFNNPRLLDIGCGWEARLLKEVEPYIAQGVGIDFKAPEINTPKIRTISHYLESKDSMPQALNGGGGQ